MNTIKKLMSIVVPIFIGGFIASLINIFLFSIVVIDGDSMSPNLRDGDRVVVLKNKSIKSDSVIVFDAKNIDTDVSKSKLYVKRVIGVPGDNVSYSNDGILLINGKKHSQSYISEKERIDGTLNMKTNSYSEYGFTLDSLSKQESWTARTDGNKIPEGYYFVMGDNRSVSNDSRYWGLVPKEKVIGVVYAPFWIPNDKNINE